MVTIVYLFSIGLSFLAVLIYWGIKKNKHEKTHTTILVILALVFVMEFFGRYTGSRGINNSLLYNIGWVYLESLLLVFYFYKIEKRASFKIWIQNVTIVLLLWGLINTLFFQPIGTVFQFYSLFPFALFIIFLCLRFLVRVLNFKIYANRNLLALPHFWIVVGMLFFYFEALAFFGMFQFNPEFIIDNLQILGNINRLLAGLMYLLFGLAFFTPYLFSPKTSSIRR